MALFIHINFTAWYFCVQHAFLSEQILIKFVLHNFTVVLVASLSYYQMLQFELHKINKGILNNVFCLLFCKQNFFIMPAELFSRLLHFGELQKDCCLVPRPHYYAQPMRFGSRGLRKFLSQIRHRNALTERAWKDAIQGLGKKDCMNQLRSLLSMHCKQPVTSSPASSGSGAGKGRRAFNCLWNLSICSKKVGAKC